MMNVAHPDIFKFLKNIIFDHSLQRAKLAKHEAALPPKPANKQAVKRNAIIVKAVKEYNSIIEHGFIMTDDENEDDSGASDDSYEFEDEEEESVPRYSIASQRATIEKNPQIKLLNTIAHNSDI